MRQEFNPKRVLRQISNPLLKEFFERQGHPLDVEWDSISNTQVDSIFNTWQRLPDGPRKDIEIIFHDVDAMVNEDGLRVIIEEGNYHGENLGPLLEQMESRHDTAIWTFMNYPSIWAAALVFAKADSLSSGRYWVKRSNLPQEKPGTDEETLRTLQSAMSAFYRERQGRGHHCRIEHFPRGSNQDYFFVYLSDYADTYINFDDGGNFQRTPERRAFEVVFAYDCNSGSLEMYANGGKKVIGPLQRIFSRVVLGQDLDAEDLNNTPYQLDGLLDRNFSFPTDPEDGIEEVCLPSLRLSVLGRKRSRITLEADPEKGPSSIYEMLEEDLNHSRLPRSVLQVTRATFNLKLNGNGRGRSLTFSVSYPNYCNLKSKRDEQRELGEKYLRRWNIDVA